MPADHPLSAKDNLDNEDLAGQTVLSLSPAYTLHDQIAALCTETGAHLSREYEGTSLDALRQMAAMDMGLTFLPALYVRSEIDARPAGDVVTKPFRGRRFSRSIGLVWRKNSGAAPAFDRIGGNDPRHRATLSGPRDRVLGAGGHCIALTRTTARSSCRLMARPPNCPRAEYQRAPA
jgi:DNA-binding transcriptional LysR family regulator